MTSRRMQFSEAVRYRGGLGMWAWVLHRVTGLGVLVFLLVHIVETFLITLGPDLYNHTLALYNSAFFRVAEVGLLFAVLYHAVNGVRVTVQDLWPGLWLRERALIWVMVVVIIAVFTPLAVLGLLPVFRGEL